MDKTSFTRPPCRIKAIGVGGGGCNALNRMVRAEIPGVEFIAVNTDVQALMRSDAPTRVQIGQKESGGLGVGGDPERGERCAEESNEELLEVVSGAHIVFISAGMGGGTGTGACPTIARLAKQSGALTVAIVTKPFQFELAKRQQIAEIGIDRLTDEVDAMIIIPNQRLLAITGQEVTVDNAFRMADEVLMTGVRTISEVITVPGLVNLDFADVKSILEDAGRCWLSIGYGTGQRRSMEAIQSAIASELIEVPIKGATGVLYVVCGPPDISLTEVREAADLVKSAVSQDASVFFGVTFDPKMESTVRITLIATGFTSNKQLAAERSAQEFQQVIQGLESDEGRLDAPAFKRRPVSLRQLTTKKKKAPPAETSAPVAVVDAEEQARLEEEQSKGLYEMASEKLAVEGEGETPEAEVESSPTRSTTTMLDGLHPEIVLADADDTIAYFNKETSSKLSLRKVVGHQLQDCYPAESVALVNHILDEFRRGTEDGAEFQIDVDSKRVNIRIFAIRDEDGKYLGCVEVTQRVTHQPEE